MMAFVLMTISFTVALLLAGFISMIIMLSPIGMKLYMKYIQKSMANMVDAMNELDS